jgi:hypothetical protein
MTDKDLHKAYQKLFVGSSLTFGQWNPSNGKMHTEKTEAKLANFSSHLMGKIGIGIVPVAEDAMCRWGAIDIDCHKEDEFINIDIIAKTIFAKGLPIIPCRSKSGGVHCYIFTSDPVSATVMKRLLKHFAKEIGYDGAEIFPKQSELRDNQTGNWINLPYFDGDNTTRYAIEIRDNKPIQLSLLQFVQFAESCKLNMAMFKSFLLSGHEQAPPCIQQMIIEGVPKGVRNEALYALTIYLKKKMPAGTYKNQVLVMNNLLFEKPLTLTEANKTILSASRSEYRYKCTEEPCRSNCDGKTCITREFGIDPGDSFSTGEGMPDFTRLRIINTEPPLWEVTVNNVAFITTTRVLRNFQLLAEELMDRLLLVVPILRQKDWMMILGKLMENVEHIEVPDNASTEGIIREKLTEFMARANFNSNGKDTSDRDLIERGLPVIQAGEQEGERIVMFRGSDYISFLKRTKSEELKGAALWMALRKMGVFHKRVRVARKIANIWCIPVDGKGRSKLDYDYDPNSRFIHSDENKTIQIISRLNF